MGGKNGERKEGWGKLRKKMWLQAPFLPKRTFTSWRWCLNTNQSCSHAQSTFLSCGFVSDALGRCWVSQSFRAQTGGIQSKETFSHKVRVLSANVC